MERKNTRISRTKAKNQRRKMKNKDYEEQGLMHPDYPESEDEFKEAIEGIEPDLIYGSEEERREIMSENE